jgi:hypothetical protein
MGKIAHGYDNHRGPNPNSQTWDFAKQNKSKSAA